MFDGNQGDAAKLDALLAELLTSGPDLDVLLDVPSGLDALQAQWEAQRQAFEAWLATLPEVQRELDALFEAMRPEQEAYLAQLEAEWPQREAELATLLAQLEGKDDTGATQKR